jgi:hypothetical protein
MVDILLESTLDFTNLTLHNLRKVQLGVGNVQMNVQISCATRSASCQLQLRHLIQLPVPSWSYQVQNIYLIAPCSKISREKYL